jgi:cyclase
MQSVKLIAALTFCLVGNTNYARDAASTRPINSHQVAANVYMLDNGTDGFHGGNVAVFVGASEIVLVDAQSSDSNADAMIAAIKRISDKPIRYVINTHCHGDHTGGNATLKKIGATFIAHQNVQRRIEAKKCDHGHFPGPSITFDAEFLLRADGEEVRVIKLPTGHTDGDSIVYFKNANVVHTGDVYVSVNLPFDSKYAGGTMLGLIDQLARIIEIVPDNAKVIPGHGPIASMTDIRKSHATLVAVKEAVAQQIHEGKKLDELVKGDFLKPLIGSVDIREREYYLRKFYDALQFSL